MAQKTTIQEKNETIKNLRAEARENAREAHSLAKALAKREAQLSKLEDAAHSVSMEFNAIKPRVTLPKMLERAIKRMDSLIGRNN